jgi:hypothetical protein
MHVSSSGSHHSALANADGASTRQSWPPATSPAYCSRCRARATQARDRLRRINRLSANEVIGHDLAIVFDVRRRRRGEVDLGHVQQAAGSIVGLLTPKLSNEGVVVDADVLVDEGDRGAVNQSVSAVVEGLGTNRSMTWWMDRGFFRIEPSTTCSASGSCGDAFGSSRTSSSFTAQHGPGRSRRSAVVVRRSTARTRSRASAQWRAGDALLAIRAMP